MFIKYKVTKYGGTLICVNHELSMYNAISKETYCAKLVTRPDQTTQAAVGKVKFTILHCLEPIGGEPVMSMMHGQCDSRPTVTFPADWLVPNYTAW